MQSSHFCSILSSHSIAMATAMAISGAFVLLALRRPPPPPRPCLSSGASAKRKAKKKVKFADDVVDRGGGEAFRRRKAKVRGAGRKERSAGGMPANRVAMYTAILKDRNRLASAFGSRFNPFSPSE